MTTTMPSSETFRQATLQHGDVYLATRSMVRIEKYNFHASGICRSAFTQEHGVPRTMTDRAMFKWNRSPTPPPGNLEASRVAWIAFPSTKLGKEILSIDAAPQGGATYLEFAFTRESESTIGGAFNERQERRLLRYTPLPFGDAFFVNCYHADWDNKNLTVRGDGQVNDLLFSADDPDDTGRPIRIRFGPRPDDGGALVLRELGGFAVVRTDQVSSTTKKRPNRTLHLTAAALRAFRLHPLAGRRGR